MNSVATSGTDDRIADAQGPNHFLILDRSRKFPRRSSIALREYSNFRFTLSLQIGGGRAICTSWGANEPYKCGDPATPEAWTPSSRSVTISAEAPDSW